MLAFFSMRDSKKVLYSLKKMRYRLALFLFFGILATSCNKNKSEQDSSSYHNTFSTSVNGGPFIPTSIEVLFGGSSIPNGRQVNFYATAANGHQVTLIMLDYDGTLKTFTRTIGAYSITPGAYNSSYSTNGEIRLSSIDKSRYQDGEVVTGTFQFDTDSLYGTYHITNGQFSVFVKK
jgi:hypothetical protein